MARQYQPVGSRRIRVEKATKWAGTNRKRSGMRRPNEEHIRPTWAAGKGAA